MGQPLNPTLEERFQQTSAWAEWAEGLKKAIKESVLYLGVKKGFGGNGVKKMLNREEWRRHIVQGHRPFRRDCRACVLGMANGPQHRRRAFGGASAWSLGVDIVQFGKTRDAVTNVDVKYAVVATALVPRFETPETDEDGKIHPHEKVEIPDWGEGLNEEEFPLDGVREDSEKEIDDSDEKSPKMEPFLGEDEPPKGGKIDPSKYPQKWPKS